MRVTRLRGSAIRGAGLGILAALVALIACEGDRFGPTEPPEGPPVPGRGHPVGVVAGTFELGQGTLSGFSAVTDAGVAYVTALHTGLIHRVDLDGLTVTSFRPTAAYTNLRGIAISSNGQSFHVAAQDSRVATFDVQDLVKFDAEWRPVHAYRTGSIWYAPIPVALSVDQRTAYTATAGAVVHAVDVERGHPRFAVAAGGANVSLVVHPTRPALYVSGSGRVDEVDTGSGTARRVDLSDDSDVIHTHTQSIGLSPDGRELYVVHWQFDRSAVLVWDTDRRTVVDSIMLPGRGLGLVVTPDGEHIYVGSEGARGELWIFDRARRTHVRTISVGGVVGRLAISPDGRTVVAVNHGGWVDFIR